MAKTCAICNRKIGFFESGIKCDACDALYCETCFSKGVVKCPTCGHIYSPLSLIKEFVLKNGLLCNKDVGEYVYKYEGWRYDNRVFTLFCQLLGNLECIHERYLNFQLCVEHSPIHETYMWLHPNSPQKMKIVYQNKYDGLVIECEGSIDTKKFENDGMAGFTSNSQSPLDEDTIEGITTYTRVLLCILNKMLSEKNIGIRVKDLGFSQFTLTI